MRLLAAKRFLLEGIWTVGFRRVGTDPEIRGWYGEWMARRHLRSKKMQVIHRNWRSSLDRRREIDLICLDLEILVFVEVRARSSSALSRGFDSISATKKKALLHACRDFLRKESGKFPHYRFDVVEIDLDASTDKLFHHVNVSLFP